MEVSFQQNTLLEAIEIRIQNVSGGFALAWGQRKQFLCDFRTNIFFAGRKLISQYIVS